MHLLLKRIYGSTSEKFDPQQGVLFDPRQARKRLAANSPAPPPVARPASKNRDKHGRGRIPDKIQREEVIHDLSEAEKAALGGAENLVELPPETERATRLAALDAVRVGPCPQEIRPQRATARERPDARRAERGGGPQAARGDSRRFGRSGADGPGDRQQGRRPFALVPPGRDFPAAGRENLPADDGRLVAPDGRVPPAIVHAGRGGGSRFSRHPYG